MQNWRIDPNENSDSPRRILSRGSMRLESQRITNFKNEDVSPIMASAIDQSKVNPNKKESSAMIGKIGGYLAF